MLLLRWDYNSPTANEFHELLGVAVRPYNGAVMHRNSVRGIEIDRSGTPYPKRGVSEKLDVINHSNTPLVLWITPLIPSGMRPSLLCRKGLSFQRVS